MPSLFRLMPVLEDEVMDRVPVDAAPNTIFTEAISLSPCTKWPPTSGSLRAKYSGKNQAVKGESMVAEDWMQSDYDELLGIKSQMDVLKDRKKELEEELEKAIMGFAAIYGKDGETVLATRVPKTPKPELDRELLRKEYESVYERYLLVQEAVFNEALFKKECRDLYDQYLVTPEAGDPEFKVAYPRKTPARKTETIF
jgi:hypothetical protein